MVRRMQESLLTGFGPVLTQTDWSFLVGLPINQMVEEFQEYATWLVDKAFPKKAITTVEGDQPFFTK